MTTVTLSLSGLLAEIAEQRLTIHDLEQQLEGWRNSDTGDLIRERDEAREALADARHHLGLRHPTPVGAR